MSKISNVNAIQVFDSRGIPTIACEISLDNGICATAMVPSGASTGSKEALELRDSDSNYHGKGVLNAISNINNCLLYTSPSPRDVSRSRMPSSA